MNILIIMATRQRPLDEEGIARLIKMMKTNLIFFEKQSIKVLSEFGPNSRDEFRREKERKIEKKKTVEFNWFNDCVHIERPGG